MTDPFKLLILYCADIAVAEYILGRMNVQEAIEYGMKMVDKYVETKEFDKAVEDYYSKFVSVKDLKLVYFCGEEE